VTDAAERARRTRLRARTYQARLDDVAADFVGRDDVVRVVGLATLSREHVLLIGPPGTAKTSLLDSFRRVLDVRYFPYLLTRFTEPAELFGPMDVTAFQRESRYRLNTDGMLPTAHLAFLDEVFQGSSAILNSLLMLMNERRFHNGSTTEDAELLTLLGSTNELPDDPVLSAFSDRFLLRVTIDYVGPDQVDDLLRTGWRREQQAVAGGDDPDLVRFPLAELRELQAEIAHVDVGAVRGELADVVRTLRREGVVFSDRRAVKAQKLVAASALLDARVSAEPKDLGVLAYLWTKPGDDTTVRRILADHDVVADDAVRRTRSVAALRLDLTELAAAPHGPVTREQLREQVRLLHRLSREAGEDHPTETDLRSRIDAAHSAALEVLRRHEEAEN
jgi:MoxR-like ATPase